MYPREYFDTYWRPEIRSEVFVAMSFADEFADVWKNIIRPAIEVDLSDFALRANRVDTRTISGSILSDIMDGIAHSCLVLADISVEAAGYRNPNVLYEVGLAHALRQATEVILIRQDHERLNFDVAPIRVHRYDPNDTKKSRNLLTSCIRNCLSEIDLTKTLNVQRAADTLDAISLDFIERHARKDQILLVRSVAPSELPGYPKELREQYRRLASDMADDDVTVVLATVRLTELGIIRCNPVTGTGGSRYHYRWTPFGRAVVEHLGFGMANG